jgi:GH35 family endo-1,4-beta-xylanase
VGAGILVSVLSDPKEKHVIENFNCLTPGNAMKWQPVEWTRDKLNYADGDKLIEYAQKNNVKVRGHTLIW